MQHSVPQPPAEEFGLTRALIAFSLLAIACSSGSPDSAGSDNSSMAADLAAASQSSTGGNNGKAASVNPCTLLTDEEIAGQVDLTYEKGQRDAMHEMNVKHQISREEDTMGDVSACHISWHSVTPSGDERAKGSFDVKVMTSDRLELMEGMGRPKSGARAAAISGAGDEAFYLEYAPSARVGKLGVSIADFPDTREGNGAVELLRAAANRLR